MSIISKTSRCFLVSVCLSFLIISAVRADEYRTWTDATGKHKVRAKLESADGERAILVREDGQKVKIPLEKLSKADQDYIAKQNVDSPFEKVDGKSGDAADGDDAATSGPRTVKVNWTKSQAVLLAPIDAPWNVSVPTAPALDYHPRSVALPPKSDFFEGLTGLAVSRVAKSAVVGYCLDRMDVKTLRLLVCDLQSGRVVSTATSQGENMAPLAMHDDGHQILMCRNEFGHGTHNRLEIWTVKGKKINRGLSWTPHDGDWGPDQDIPWAEFIDADRLATASSGGKMAIWDLSTGQPICHIEMGIGGKPAISPDRKLIAIASKNCLALFDIESHEIVAAQDTPQPLGNPSLAFSPSGRKIGCIAGDRVLVWETSTGKLEKNFALPGLWLDSEIAFPDEGYLLLSKQYLIELSNQVKLWHYHGAEQVRSLNGTTFLACPGGNVGMLLASHIPHPQAVATLKKALEQPDLFVFHKGTHVKLDCSGIPDPTAKAKAEESLTKKLKDLGCPIDASAEVQLVATVEGPKPREVSYIHSGTYQVQEYITFLKFIYQGQTLWESHCTNVPSFLSLKSGENVEGVLREASSHPPYGMYERAVLPEFLQKPSQNAEQRGAGDSQMLGSSDLNEQRLRSRPIPPGFHGRRR